MDTTTPRTLPGGQVTAGTCPLSRDFASVCETGGMGRIPTAAQLALVGPGSELQLTLDGRAVPHEVVVAASSAQREPHDAIVLVDRVALTSVNE